MIAAVAAPVAFDVLDLGLGARQELLEDAVVYAEVLAINTAGLDAGRGAHRRSLAPAAQRRPRRSRGPC
jgi:hypothetical protein